ncbi:MAG: hypothetical protein KA004_01605 [Verrucomicrobiales bacterium]|nr:hypothetical protein [Verrucomicrobiales bacterium]
MQSRYHHVAAACGLSVLMAFAAAGNPLKSLPDGKLPNDARLAPPKDLDGYFPLAVPGSPKAWQQRRADVRQQLLVALGLHPLPQKPELNPVIHGRRDMGDYTVEKVYFESLPGFYVTGNLYRPRQANGNMPGILCPHGHWPNGRFMSLGDAEAQKEMTGGAEAFLCAAKSPLQARCIHLARMGCVVFHYDMIGYADSVQLSMDLAHKFGKTRPQMNDPKGWGLFSPLAEGHLQSIMGLQAWNSIRALDFLTTLPGVDAARIGVTGASGGGTQTFILGAIDDRPAVAFPAVMVSTAMQGGCTCENASLLRIRTGNVEFAGLFAPKPLAMTSAKDWTEEMETKGFPELKRLYAMLGVPDNVSLSPLTQFGHNYNHPSRKAMYAWFAKHLLHQASAPEEREFQHLRPEELTVWDEAHPKPEGGEAFEKKLTAQWCALSTAALQNNREAEVTGLRTLFGRTAETVGKTSFTLTTKHDRGAWLEMTGLVRNETHGEELPAAFLHPKNWNGRVVLWVTSAGKQSLAGPDGSPPPPVKKLLDANCSVAAADLLFQGEFTPDGKAPTKNRRVANPRLAAAYTYGYNDPLFAQRTHDLLTMIEFVRQDEHAPKAVTLAGSEGGGPWAAAAGFLAGNAVRDIVVDLQHFSFAAINDVYDPDIVPGILKYGGLDGLLGHAEAKVIRAESAEDAARRIVAGSAATQ